MRGLAAAVGLGVALATAAPARAQIACVPQTQAQLLATFSDLAAPGSITPQVMRNLVCSTVPAPLPSYTVATLPTCTAALQGTWAMVADANSPTYNGALTGSSTTIIPVFCNGTAWKAH